MIFSCTEIPTDRVVWLEHIQHDDVDHLLAVASADAPAVICLSTPDSMSTSGIVAASLDEMEVLAGQLFPAWLPGAAGITAPNGAAPAAVRALAIAHAASTGQYGPFLADLATGALLGSGTYTRRHPPEVRARGLARVLAASFQRPGCALLLRPPSTADERATQALVAAAQWLIDHGQLAVWICGGGSPPAAECLTTVVANGRVQEPAVRELRAPRPQPQAADAGPQTADAPARPVGRQRRRAPIGEPRRVVGKPHPTSRAEVALEAALASRSWAAGRAWNHTVRPGPLVNPVRVDLLWKRERCIVEIDGDDHRAADKYAEDRNRDVMLQLSGYAVLRFTNTKVLDDIESVLALIQQFLATRRRGRKGT